MNALPASFTQEFAEAYAAYSAGHPAVAAEAFARLLDAAPDHADTLRLYGLALTRSGRAGEALPYLARARRLQWHEPLAHLHHGVGLLEAGQPARAAAVLRRAAMLAPQDPAVWVNFSAALLALGHNPAARAAARRALAQAPELPEAHYTLGLGDLAAGDLDAAATAFARAIELRPAFAGAWLNLGLARYRAGNLGAAMAAMREALKIDPMNVEAEANLAAFLLLGGETDAAIEGLRSAIARAPDCTAARINLANALLLENDAPEALAVLDGPPPPGRDGKHWRAHRALALLHTGRQEQARAELDAIAPPYGDAEILVLWRRIGLAGRDEATALAERMAELVEDAAMLPEHRILGHFDLARFHTQRGGKEAAFRHWTAGHRMLARFQPYSREQFRDFVDASVALFDAARTGAGARAGNADPAPVFIVGMPRSGTTLAEHILAAHPLAFGAGERVAVHRLIRDIAGEVESRASVERLAALDAAALDALAAPFLEELHATAPQALRIIDKMPGNARHLGLLAVLLPGARFIHCRRDPRDIGLSIFQLRFFGHHPYAHDLGDLGFAIAEHERLMAHWRSLLGERLLEIELAEWVEDFPATLARTLDFLGLPYDAACEQFYTQTRQVRTASSFQVRQPVNARGIGRWRAYEEHLGPMLAELRARGLLRQGQSGC